VQYVLAHGTSVGEGLGTTLLEGIMRALLNARERNLAAEIRGHYWGDAPYRADRAGHRREDDSRRPVQTEVLSAAEAESVRMNVVWVVAQSLGYEDPSFDPWVFAEACGVDRAYLFNSKGKRSRVVEAGLGIDADGYYTAPGSRSTEA
jgi:hypothetical protein